MPKQFNIRKVARDFLWRFSIGKSIVAGRELTPFLKSKGWFLSVDQNRPVDRNGDCLPWYTYAMITFLTERVTAEMSIFEYGSGNSTLWWSRRVSHVTSCEHDRHWYEEIKSKVPGNVNYLFRDSNAEGSYSKAIMDYNQAFDCIVIDGADRVDCARNCLDALKPDGVIIWDNTEIDDYREGYAFLVSRGFKRLDFWGLGPFNPYEWCTSIFYKEINCLGI